MSATAKARRIVVLGPDEDRVARECLEALSTLDNVYERGGQLVKIVVDPATDEPRIEPITPDEIDSMLACVVEFREPIAKGNA